jgi:hypothetical protein
VFFSPPMATYTGYCILNSKFSFHFCWGFDFFLKTLICFKNIHCYRLKHFFSDASKCLSKILTALSSQFFSFSVWSFWLMLWQVVFYGDLDILYYTMRL